MKPASIFTLILLTLVVLIYGFGAWRVWRRAGAGHGLRARAVLSFMGVLLTLGIALLSPLDALAEDLFAAHMLQHLILILVAAPLLVTSDIALTLLWVLPGTGAQGLGLAWNRLRPLTSPPAAWLFFALTMWGWHAPVFFEAALQNESIHTLEHLTFLLASTLFWRPLLQHDSPAHLRYGMAVPYLFTTVLHSGVLGALMTFSAQPWYAFYAARTAAWGLSPLEDQQWAGLIMWLPGGMVFSVLTIGFFWAWLGAMDGREIRKLK